MHHTRTWALGLASMLACNGCSAIFVRSAPREKTVEFPDCTTSLAAPIADTVVALTAAGWAFAALPPTIECVRQRDCSENLGPEVLVLSGLVLLGTTASAVHGYRQTNRCRDAQASWCESHECGPFAAARPIR